MRPLQLAAIISAMDRNELEQRLLDLLKEIQPDTSEWPPALYVNNSTRK
ncbi:MAG: hypothetical protein ACKVK0_00050 [Pirellulales bacterium]